LQQETVQLWMEASNKYAENRIKSLRVQLSNDGVASDIIEQVVQDPAAVRRMIHMLRDELIKTLEQIKLKIALNDPRNPLTKKEQDLFNKHKHWFLNKGSDNDDYMPNDGAVPYYILLGEIVSMICASAELKLSEVDTVLNAFVDIGHAHMTIQASRTGWNQLKTLPTYEVCNVDVAELWRNYADDDSRVVDLETKLSSPLARGPLRFLRMSAVMFNKGGAFSLYNAGADDFMKAAVNMRATEKRVAELLAKAKFSKEGAEGMSVALAANWANVLDATDIFFARNGRNDLSVPKILAEITGHNVSMFEDLRPRSWCLMTNIVGTNRGAADLTDDFADEADERMEGDSTGADGDDGDSNDDDLEVDAEDNDIDSGKGGTGSDPSAVLGAAGTISNNMLTQIEFKPTETLATSIASSFAAPTQTSGNFANALLKPAALPNFNLATSSVATLTKGLTSTTGLRKKAGKSKFAVSPTKSTVAPK